MVLYQVGKAGLDVLSAELLDSSGRVHGGAMDATGFTFFSSFNISFSSCKSWLVFINS
jgi:hypothetical protein